MMEVSGHLLVPVTLQGERGRGAHWIRGWVGPRASLGAPSGSQTLAVQPAAHRHTDWATPVPKWMYMKIKFWEAIWIRPRVDHLNWPTSSEIWRWMIGTDRCTDRLSKHEFSWKQLIIVDVLCAMQAIWVIQLYWLLFSVCWTLNAEP
jgi:hypothetical protein